MSDTSKKYLKILGVGIAWVFVLSIRIHGHTLFYYANDILVQNQIVAAIDQTLEDAYESVTDRVKTTFNSVTGKEKSL